MAQFIENVAEVGRQNEMTKDYIPDIKGYTKRLSKEEKKEQLKKCLAEIIREHGASIKPYMSPIAMWLMIMISSATEQIAENASKNSEEATITI